MDFQTPSDEVRLPKDIPFTPLSGAGYYMAERWIIHVMEKHLDFVDLIQQKTNFKDMLIRYMQHTFQDVPKFYELNVQVKSNVKTFTYCVKDRGGIVLGTAHGASKKEAENLASKAALEYYGVSQTS